MPLTNQVDPSTSPNPGQATSLTDQQLQDDNGLEGPANAEEDSDEEEERIGAAMNQLVEQAEQAEEDEPIVPLYSRKTRGGRYTMTYGVDRRSERLKAMAAGKPTLLKGYRHIKAPSAKRLAYGAKRKQQMVSRSYWLS